MFKQQNHAHLHHSDLNLNNTSREENQLLSTMASLLICLSSPRLGNRGLCCASASAKIFIGEPSKFLNVRGKSSGIRRDLVPWLVEDELEERYTKGSGPGGQNVNKMSNAVFLKHLPTGLWVKCHQQRSLEQNRRIARKLLVTKLDNFVNGENSLENQEKMLAREKLEKKKEKTKAKYAARAALKTNDDDSGSYKESQENDSEVDSEAEPIASSTGADKNNDIMPPPSREN